MNRATAWPRRKTTRGLNDASDDAEKVVIETYRRMSIQQKWRQMGEIFHTAKVLHAAGARLRNPAAAEQAIHEDWLALTLGEDLWQTVREAKRASNR